MKFRSACLVVKLQGVTCTDRIVQASAAACDGPWHACAPWTGGVAGEEDAFPDRDGAPSLPF